MHAEGVIVGQLGVPADTNEITQVQPLLKSIAAGDDLSGVVVTADALNTQRAMAKWLTEEQNGDYVLTVKKNQPNLHRDVSIQRERYIIGGLHRSTETVYGITSLTAHQANPADVATYVRGHWGIENRHTTYATSPTTMTAPKYAPAPPHRSWLPRYTGKAAPAVRPHQHREGHPQNGPPHQRTTRRPRRVATTPEPDRPSPTPPRRCRRAAAPGMPAHPDQRLHSGANPPRPGQPEMETVIRTSLEPNRANPRDLRGHSRVRL